MGDMCEIDRYQQVLQSNDSEIICTLIVFGSSNFNRCEYIRLFISLY